MNCEQANAVRIIEILEKLNFKAEREDKTDAYYKAPWRDEKTASLHINKEKNIWYDHGLNKGGKTIAFVQEWLKSTGVDDTIHDALRWLPNMNLAGNIHEKKPVRDVTKVSAWKLLDVQPVKNPTLIRYLENRGIDFGLTKKHICEVYIKSVKKDTKLYALGFKNENGGYELRNPFLKSCISPKTITFIRGSKSKPPGIHLFEGFMDYLTFLTIKKGWHEDDAIVINSVSCIDDALMYIKNYGYTNGYTWMDNDKAGLAATETLAKFFKSENIKHTKLNGAYAEHKDFNAAHMYRLSLS